MIGCHLCIGDNLWLFDGSSPQAGVQLKFESHDLDDELLTGNKKSEKSEPHLLIRSSFSSSSRSIQPSNFWSIPSDWLSALVFAFTASCTSSSSFARVSRFPCISFLDLLVVSLLPSILLELLEVIMGDKTKEPSCCFTNLMKDAKENSTELI